MPETKQKRKRRGRGEGSICQRANGTWFAMATIGQDTNGKQLRRTVSGETKKEVQDKLTKLKTQAADGMLTNSGKLKVGEYLDSWVEDSARMRVSDGTLAYYKSVIKNWIKPRIGGVLLSKLTPANLQALYSKMEKDGASQDRRRLAHSTMRRALNVAVKLGLLPRNVCHAVEPPKAPKTDIHPLNAKAAAALLKAADGDRQEALYVLAVTCGLRMGELFALQWEDWSGSGLQVRHTISEVGGQQKLKEPKTKSSRRRVELPRLAVTALHEHRKRMMTEGKAASKFIFVNESGTWWRRSHFHTQCFRPLLKKAGLPHMRFHDLRHTSATLLLEQGVHPKVVQERLGHSQISVTLDTYSHVLPGMQEEAAGKLDRLFAASGA